MVKEDADRAQAQALWAKGRDQSDHLDYQAALESLDAALQIAPDLVVAWDTRGTVLHMLGRADEALASFKQAHQLDPDLWPASYHIGLWLKMHDRFSESIGFLMQCKRSIRRTLRHGRWLNQTVPLAV